LLPNGKVLVAGGVIPYFSSAELYDPATGSWTATGSLNTARYTHTATLLPNGKVLVAGGYDSAPLSSAELYDPATGSWSVTDNLNTARSGHTATLLPNGEVLIAAGGNNGGFLASAELYDIGLGFVRPDWQPQIATVTQHSDGSLALTGSRFQGISQASGGNYQDSSTNYPLVQLRAIDNSQVVFLLVDPIAGWSEAAFTSIPVNNFPPGPALVTVLPTVFPVIRNTCW
jgi:Kelch motif